jgi:hypothetical protein
MGERLSSRTARDLNEEFLDPVSRISDSEKHKLADDSNQQCFGIGNTMKRPAEHAGAAAGNPYEAKRLVNIRNNEEVFKSLGLVEAVSSSSHSKQARKSSKASASDASVFDGPRSQFSSPTRGSVHRQKNDILLVFGGPIHCTDPINADTCYLLLPLSSKGITSLLFWPGNRTSY